MLEIAAIMPIKTNNERLPGKNTKLLGNKPLIQYQLEALGQADLIKKIYVYCSNPEIEDYLTGGAVYMRRPKYLDEPTSNFTQIFEEFMSAVDAGIYVYAHATAPYISVETINECIDAVVNKGYDSAFCATKIQDFLWQDGKPLNFDASNIPRSQDLKPIYRETSGVYVFTREVFTSYRRRIGINPYVKEVSAKEAIDINTSEDFAIAEAALRL